MQITKQQLETLRTGKATIEIDKEWVKCPECREQQMAGDIYSPRHKGCKGKTPKYKIGNEICKMCHCDDCIAWHNINHDIKLKIISETEDKQRCVEV